MTTSSRASLIIVSLKKTILDVANARGYRDRGQGFLDAPPVTEKTPLAQDLEAMIDSSLTRPEERDVLIETLVVVRVLLELKGEEWGERVRRVFEKGV